MPDHKDLVIAFGPAKEGGGGDSPACRKLARLLGVPEEKYEDFQHLFDAAVSEADERAEGPEEEEHEEKGEGEDMEGGEY